MMKNKQHNIHEDQFNRLPDELIIFIFNKLSEAKSLCRCSTVSKKFASLIYQASYVTIPEVEVDGGDQVLPPLWLYPFESVANFLKKFRSIETVELQLSFPPKIDLSNTIIKWNVDLSEIFGISSCVFLFAQKEDIDGHGYDEFSTTLSDDQIEDLYEYLRLLTIQVGFNVLLLVMLVKNLIRFRTSVIMDSLGHTKIHLDEVQIMDMEDSQADIVIKESDHYESGFFPLYDQKLWYVPTLRLPSGRVLKGVQLALMSIDPDYYFEEDEVIVRKAFQGEDDEEEFGWAVMEMLKQKPIYSELYY